MVTSIPVSKGQRFYLSIAAYNRCVVLITLRSQVCMCTVCRLKSVWGEDADEWNPERFLKENEKMKKISLGVISNLYGDIVIGCGHQELT